MVRTKLGNSVPDIPVDVSADGQGLSKEQRGALPPFATIRAFEAIGTLGGIRRAAVALSVDHAAVSRHLRSLEAWTGTTLMERGNGAGSSLTPQGLAYHRRLTAALAEIARATQDLRYSGDGRKLRIWCTPGLASEWLTGRIGLYMANHLDIEIELHPNEAGPNFDVQQADVHVHYVIDAVPLEQNQKLRTINIARPPVLAVASPDYLAAQAPIERPEDLLSCDLLHESNDGQWRRWLAQLDVKVDSTIGGPRFWQGHLTLAAARRGQGIALANALLVEDDLARGTLVAIDQWRPVFLGSYAFTARGDGWRGRTVASFRRWLESAIAQSLNGDHNAPVGT